MEKASPQTLTRLKSNRYYLGAPIDTIVPAPIGIEPITVYS